MTTDMITNPLAEINAIFRDIRNRKLKEDVVSAPNRVSHGSILLRCRRSDERDIEVIALSPSSDDVAHATEEFANLFVPITEIIADH